MATFVGCWLLVRAREGYEVCVQSLAYTYPGTHAETQRREGSSVDSSVRNGRLVLVVCDDRMIVL